MSQPTTHLLALADFNDARLDEDELWATEASRRDSEQAPDGGVHWHWVANSNDQEITPDPSRESYVGEDAEEAVSLRSRETWPTTSGVGDLPQFALYADEVPSAVGGHIIRHDPARVLAEVAAKRVLIANWRELIQRIDAEQDAEKRERLALTRHGMDQVAHQLAAVHANHPDYQESWRP
ncbi:DUF6221 family protein [Streptomyces tibetensis]|uniref:DUF6221 family protein n=1 Tax=Streptomyces tibetensis TaxID=2382123 RepID=A0ABW6N8E7_9ACTN